MKISIRLNSRFYPLLFIALIALQWFTPYQAWKILLVGIGGAWLLGFVWARALARGLRFAREMRFGWAQVGDRLEERFVLSNDTWLPALWVEVRDQSTLPDYNVSLATGIGGGETTTWLTQGVCARRGLFTLGPTQLRCGDPFGFYTVTIGDNATASLLVMPPIIPLPTIEVASGGRMGEGRQRVSFTEPTVSASRVRAYQTGDQWRWIHWRVSAHRDALHVRQFDTMPAGDWWVCLDVNASAQVGEREQGEDTLEHSVILAASLAAHGLREGRAVGVMAHSEPPVWLRPQAGEEQRWSILRALTTVNASSHSLAAALMHAQTLFQQASSLIVITPDTSGAWLPALWQLARRGFVPTVLLLDPPSYGAVATSDSGVQRVTASLAELDIAHAVITRELLDRPELRAGKQGQWQWRVSGTGRAIAVEQPRDLQWRTLA